MSKGAPETVEVTRSDPIAQSGSLFQSYMTLFQRYREWGLKKKFQNLPLFKNGLGGEPSEDVDVLLQMNKYLAFLSQPSLYSNNSLPRWRRESRAGLVQWFCHTLCPPRWEDCQLLLSLLQLDQLHLHHLTVFPPDQDLMGKLMGRDGRGFLIERSLWGKCREENFYSLELSDIFLGFFIPPLLLSG